MAVNKYGEQIDVIKDDNDVYIDEQTEAHAILTFDHNNHMKSLISLDVFRSGIDQLAIGYSNIHPEVTLTLKDNHLYLECQDSDGLLFKHELI